VSPPSMAARNGASGFKMLFICDSKLGKSLIQCKLRLLKTASKVPGAYGKYSRSEMTSRFKANAVSKEDESSRCSREVEVSVHVRVDMRFGRSGSVGEAGVSERDGLERARARLRV
jgi:hypothetical protein